MLATARTSGYMLIFLALAALTWDVMPLLQGGAFKLSSWGEFWYGTHSPSLGAVKSGIEGLSAGLWTWTMAPLRKVPALLLFGLPGAVLASLPWMLPKLRSMRAPRHAQTG